MGRSLNHFSFQLQPESLQNGRLNSFLTLKDPQGPAVRQHISKIEILLEDGVWLPLTSTSIELESSAIGGRQLFLGSEPIPPGRYTRIRMRVTKRGSTDYRGEFDNKTLESYFAEYALEREIKIDAGDSLSLHFTWDPEKAVSPDGHFLPDFTAAPATRPILEDLVFVSCPNIDTVFVVRADKNWVIDSFGVNGGPTYLTVDSDPSQQRLYVLTARDNKLKVVNLASYRVVDFFAVPLNDIPSYVAFKEDGKEAYIIDRDDGYLSRISLETGQILARVHLGHKPSYAAYLGQYNLLAVSMSLSQKVVLLDPNDLRIVRQIPSGSSPQGLALVGEQLFIAESGDSTVSIFEFTGKENGGRFAVGFSPSRLLYADSQIYVSNYLDGSLSVLMPGQLGVMQEINGLNRPKEMVFHPFYRRLYVTEGANTMAVIDTTSNLPLERIVLGARPFALAKSNE